MTTSKYSSSLPISRLHKLLAWGLMLTTACLLAYHFFVLSVDMQMTSKAHLTYAKLAAESDSFHGLGERLPELEVGGKRLFGWALIKFPASFGETCIIVALSFIVAYALLTATGYILDFDLSASYSTSSEALLTSDLMQFVPAIVLLLVLYAENTLVMTEPLPLAPVVSFGFINTSTPDTWLLNASPIAFLVGVAIAAGIRDA